MFYNNDEFNTMLCSNLQILRTRSEVRSKVAEERSEGLAGSGGSL